MLIEIQGSKGYHFNEHGQVFDPKNELVAVRHSVTGRLLVKIKIDQNHKYSRRSVARLILGTVDPKENEHWLSVRHKDGDITNVRPDNLEWSEELYVPDCSENCCVIPGFSQYTITREGEVVDTLTGLTKERYVVREDGRTSVRLWSGTRHVQIGVYRLMALTYLTHPHDTDHLWVNHLDGIPAHDFLENIEWCTPGENTSHAYSTGLRDGNRTILARNVMTGEISEHQTLADLARKINSTPARIYMYLSGRVISKFSIHLGYQFKYGDDPAPWGGPTRSWTDRGILVRTLADNKVVRVSSPWQVTKMTGIPEASVRSLLQGEYIRPWFGRMVQWQPSPDCLEAVWPDYDPEVVAALEKMTRKSKSCYVTCLTTGTKRFFHSVVDWIRTDNIPFDPATVGRGLLRHKNEWAGYRVELVDPATLATYVTLPVEK